jgi:hypothetical protein
MRPILYTFAFCFGAAVRSRLADTAEPLTRVSTLVTISIALASATVMVFKLGGQQQQMQNMTQNVDAALRRYREELDRMVARFDGLLASIDQFVRVTTDHRIAIERWQAHVDAPLGTIDTRVARVEQTERREAA